MSGNDVVAMFSGNAQMAAISDVTATEPQGIVYPSVSNTQLLRGESFDASLLREFAISMSSLMSK